MSGCSTPGRRRAGAGSHHRHGPHLRGRTSTDGGNEAWLWVSTAEEGSPTSYRIALPLDGPMPEPADPADDALAETYPGAFLPVDNHEGSFEEGPVVPPMSHSGADEMTQEGGSGWRFIRGGMLYRTYAEHRGRIPARRRVPGVPDLRHPPIQPNGAAFESARFAWAPDGDGLAVWDAGGPACRSRTASRMPDASTTPTPSPAGAPDRSTAGARRRRHRGEPRGPRGARLAASIWP